MLIYSICCLPSHSSDPVIRKVAVQIKPAKLVMLCGMQALMSIINDTLGTPLFDTRMAALQLPMSATIHSITDYPGESITDQIASVRPHHPFPVWQLVLIVFAASLGIVAMILTTVVWRKKRQKQQSGRDGLASQVYCSLLAACLLNIFTYDATRDSKEQDVQSLQLYIIVSSGKQCCTPTCVSQSIMLQCGDLRVLVA